MKIAVDGMGGDYAPEEIVQGVLNALEHNKELEILLFISEQKAGELLPASVERLEVRFSQSVMAMDEPVENLRRKKDSSIFMATRAVSEGEADAIVSCGSTGAQLAAAILLLGRIKGVKRPAILIPYPTLQGNKIMLDGGASVDVGSRDLRNFALMGNAYVKLVYGIASPAVVLLSNGTEPHKGTELVRETHELLREEQSLDFRGNIEGRDIIKGEFDVLVTDGFSGNLAMKVTEGVASGLFKLIKKEITATASRKIGAALVKPGLMNLASMFDYNKYGGMPLLGVKGISVVCHGSSKREAVENGIKVAADFAAKQLIQKLEEAL